MKLKLFASLAIAACAATTTFGGLIGENYIQPALSYVRVSDVGVSTDGWASSVDGNVAVLKTDRFGVDVGGGVMFARVTNDWLEMKGHEVSATVRGYMTAGIFKPFVEASTGWAWTDAKLKGTSISDDYDSWSYDFAVGAEASITEQLSMVLSAGWGELEEDGDGNFTFGAAAHYWFNESLGGELGYQITEGSVKTHVVTTGLSIRF